MKDRKTKIKELRLKGWTYQKIADKFGVTKQSVHQICQYHSFKVHKKLNVQSLKKLSQPETKLSKEDLKGLLANVSNLDIANFFLYLLGFTTAEIAQWQTSPTDDVIKSIEKLSSIEKHLDCISAIQEMFRT